jgi:hypothetical protein
LTDRCCRPIFASGASTVSPLFRILDFFRGTLIVDKSDFRFCDEKSRDRNNSEQWQCTGPSCGSEAVRG